MKKLLAAIAIITALTCSSARSETMFPNLLPQNGDDQLTILKKILKIENNGVVIGGITDAEIRATALAVSLASIPLATGAATNAGITGTSSKTLTDLDAKLPALSNSKVPTEATITGSQYTIAISSVTTDGTVAAGKHHIEFIFSSTFTGTIGSVAFTGTVGVYNPGDAPVGSTFGALSYTVAAGSAILTTW